MKKNKKSKNGSTTLTLDKLQFPSYESIMSDIENKVGKLPKLPTSLPKGNWSPQATKVLEERYLQKDKNGRITETPDEMAWRVSWNIASAQALWGADKKEVLDSAKDFYNLLITHKFLPNSPTLMNAGTGNMLQYSACFVLPVEDSLVGIFDALKYQALIHQSGGGTGFSFSRLRSQGSMVRSSGGVASGPVSFMRIFDAATNEVKQGGKRRGANMGILRVDHPDILEFINCKNEGGITNFNISVAITDEFMKAYGEDGDYNLVNPNDNQVTGTLKAREVFERLALGAHTTGDPGVIFIDKINDSTANPVPPIGPVESTNPCGEQPLYPFDSCNLGSIFLSYFVKSDGDTKDVDWEELKRVTRLATRFMDNVIEVNPYPLDQIKKTSLAIRRIGLGVGGWADLLIELGIPYDSEKALNLGRRVMKVIQEEAVAESQKLAKERGPFPLFPVSIYKNQKPRRNSTVTTIAPTGTISIIANTSSGIEPIFAIAYQHIVKDKHLDRTLTFVNPKFEEIAKDRGFWSDSLKEKIAAHGVIRDIDEIPQDVKDLFGTAHEIEPEWHIRTQAAFQEFTENAVSKTINMRNEVTVEDIKKTYLMAWETNCKGITVFRDGCKDAQVLNLGVKNRDKPIQDEPWSRPVMVTGSTYKIKTPVGTAFITVNHDEAKNPIEVFINIGRAGSDVQAMAEALGRLISKSLRFGNKLTAKDRATVIIDQLRGIGGRTSVGFGANKIRSLPDAVAFAMAMDLGIKINGNGVYHAEHTNGQAGAVVAASSPSPSITDGVELGSAQNFDPTTATALTEQLELTTPGDICPSCGASALVYEEGCVKCHACGHSEC